jgi:hypothetical protein
MSNKEYVRELCAGYSELWALDQLADDLDKRDDRIVELKAALRDIYTLNVSAEGYERHCFRLKDIAGKALGRGDDSSD